MENRKVIESLLKEYGDGRRVREDNASVLEMLNFLDLCISTDTSDGGAVIRALYIDGKSYRAVARSMFLSRGAVEYNKKKAIQRYAERFEKRFQTS
jgi:DNA-directed RNA polymerase specialized sigma24 family protein